MEKINPDDARMIFSYRTRMANFSEHLWGPAGPKLCPLCSTHLDNQQMAFICPVVKPNLSTGKYEALFRDEIPMETVENLRRITKIREEYLDK